MSDEQVAAEQRNTEDWVKRSDYNRLYQKFDAKCREVNRLAALSTRPQGDGVAGIICFLETYLAQWEKGNGGCAAVVLPSDFYGIGPSGVRDGLKAAIAALRRPAQSWQLIESAPKDDWFLARWYAAAKDGHCSWICIQARRSPHFKGRGYFETWDGRLFPDPTHWMPLPAPPPQPEQMETSGFADSGPWPETGT